MVAVIPALLLSRLAGFQLNWIWYLSVVSVLVQLAFSYWLLQRELTMKLN